MIGLTLIRVLRKGLWLGEYLGGLLCRANEMPETASRTHVPNAGADGERHDPTGASVPGRVTALASLVVLGRSVLLVSTVSV
jgi:hypothetical protein